MRTKRAGLMDWSDRDGIEREAARHQTYAGLRMQQESKGYKPGFVGVKFREMYGTWPNGETGTAAAPMAHVLGLWLKRGKTRYAAARKKAKQASITAESEARGGRIAMLKRVASMTMQRESLSSSSNSND